MTFGPMRVVSVVLVVAVNVALEATTTECIEMVEVPAASPTSHTQHSLPPPPPPHHIHTSTTPPTQYEQPRVSRESEGREHDNIHRGRVRKKRATYFLPPGSVFETEFSITIPIPMPSGESIPLKLEVPLKLDLPNITFSNFLEGRKSIYRDERFNVYGIVEGLFYKFGMDGRACVLRAVCEKAQITLEGTGILGEIIGNILGASSASSYTDLYEYIQAEEYGRMEGDCWALYPSCPVSFFKWID
ncbi:hypothetical protein Pcinc_029862 [Petrolisthes cinctipes]|uniref:Uncharacterized protein n=1 Tax=Petrolisthes cinctipes TaxID=88211 RepID=A0AAE1F0F9_PETCI|nr:hypothetical protein Pcinc_029862 [Petrolisthes cinctipes]